MLQAFRALAPSASTLVGVGLMGTSIACYRLLTSRRRNWVPGEKQPAPFSDDWESFDPDAMTVKAKYNMFISLVVPRPIALVSSISASGNGNLAPYSYFGAMSHDPPIVAIGCCVSRTGKKNTLVNIEETREFTVNIMSRWYLDAANFTCGPFAPDVNEFEVSGLTPINSMIVKPPRVAEAAAQMECQVYQLIPLSDAAGKHANTIVLGRVIRYHTRKEVLQVRADGVKEVNPAKYEVVGRMGGDTYVHCEKFVDLPRVTEEQAHKIQAELEARRN